MSVHSSDVDLVEMVRAARSAMNASGWRDPERRSAFLEAVAAALEAARADVVATAAQETGYPADRIGAELDRTILQLALFAAEARTPATFQPVVSAARTATAPRPDLRRMDIPIGPVAVFAASNLALAFGVAGGDTASAWAAGCPVIAKSHPAQPRTSELIAEIVEEVVVRAGLPAAVFQHLDSPDISVAQDLVRAPALAAVAFTGSVRAGRAIFDIAAARPVPIPVYAEMGSVNPLIVTEAALEARGETIARGLAASVLSVSGQLCTKPGVALVPKGGSGDVFVTQLLAAIEEQPVERMLTPDHLARYTASISLLEHAGVGRRGTTRSGQPEIPQTAVYELDASDAGSNPEALDEHFGPAVVVVRFASLEDAADVAASRGGQLTVSIHAEESDADEIAELLPRLVEVAGRLVFDGFPTGVVVDDAMVHGGPYPATTAPGFSAVGRHSIRRFLRPVAWQNAPAWALPRALHDAVIGDEGDR